MFRSQILERAEGKWLETKSQNREKAEGECFEAKF